MRNSPYKIWNAISYALVALIFWTTWNAPADPNLEHFVRIWFAQDVIYGATLLVALFMVMATR